MKAILSKQPGGPESLVLEERPDPQPAAGQVVLAVKACGVNYPDVLVIEDKYQGRPARPFSPGTEVAGIVEKVGAGVEHVKAGDRVLAQVNWGGMAEKVAVDAAQLMAMPESMSFDVAASFLMTYATSYYALKQRARLVAGETLLVLGAAGGVGLAAVELGKAMGARVVAAASTSAKVDLAKAHGADEGIVYPALANSLDKAAARSLSESFKQASEPGGANVIYDAVGGDYAEAALRSIAWDGRYLVVGFPAGIPRIPLNLTLLKSCQIVGVFWGASVARDRQAHQQNVRELFALHAAGRLKPHVSQSYPLAQAGAAIAHLASRQAMGKVVVRMD